MKPSVAGTPKVHCSVELAFLRNLGQVKGKVRALNFRKANCQLLKELVNETPGKLPSGTRSRAELEGL